MELRGLTGQFFRICEITSKMAYVNLLWIIFTIIGLGVFGFAPATVALFAVIRKWIMGDSDIQVFSTFLLNYRKEFLKSNLLGLILLSIGFILFIDFVYLPMGGLYTFFRAILILVSIMYIVILLFIFPFYVHYDWEFKLYFKNSLLIGLGHPHIIILIIIGIIIHYQIIIRIPGIIPFFSISVFAYIIMSASNIVIKKWNH